MNNQGPPVQDVNGYPAATGLWRVMAGFINWALAFVVLYGGHAVACLYATSQAGASMVSFSLVLLWVAHLVVALILAWQSRRSFVRTQVSGKPYDATSFMCRVALLLDVFAVGAVLVTGLPVLAVPACVP